MRLPRDVSGEELVGALRALRALGYEPSRQTGSHVRLAPTRGGEHHITVPKHDRLRVGTLAGILAEVARHHAIEREELVRLLFGR